MNPPHPGRAGLFLWPVPFWGDRNRAQNWEQMIGVEPPPVRGDSGWLLLLLEGFQVFVETHDTVSSNAPPGGCSRVCVTTDPDPPPPPPPQSQPSRSTRRSGCESAFSFRPLPLPPLNLELKNHLRNKLSYLLKIERLGHHRRFEFQNWTIRSLQPHPAARGTVGGQATRFFFHAVLGSLRFRGGE